MVNGSDLVTHHVRAQGSNGLELQNASSGIIVSMGAGGGTQASFTGAVTANSISASTITGIGNVTDYSASVDNRLDSLEAATSSYVTSAITASSLVTASVSLNTITFTKGDASTFNITVNTGSATTTDLTSLNAFTASQDTKNSTLATYTGSNDTKWNTLGGLTGSYATTGSNSFVGNQTITGSLILSSSAAVELQVIGNLVLTGSAIGNVVSMSVTSNTASMNFNLGNYFELTASVSPIRIEVSNLSGGVTSTLALNGVTSSTINWSSNVLQPSGSAYTASVSGSNDILSFVAFNSGKVNVVSTLKMI
jgi:hypothetical protein